MTMDYIFNFNELNTSFNTIWNSLPFGHNSVVGWFVGICVVVSSTGGTPLCLILGGMSMYEYQKNVDMMF